MESQQKVLYFIYQVILNKQGIEWIKLTPEAFENNLRDFLKDYKIKNLIYPTRSGDVFLTVEAKEENTLPVNFENKFYDLIRKPRTLSEVLFLLDSRTRISNK